MTSTPSKVYGQWANAELTFTVTDGLTGEENPRTGNPVVLTREITYQAALKVQRPRWEKEPGVDVNTFRCSGRLLTPAELDPRISSGSKAVAVINGRRGRFTLEEDISPLIPGRPVLRQPIEGSFEVIGGIGAAPFPAPMEGVA